MFPLIARKALYDKSNKSTILVGEQGVADKAQELGLEFERSAVTLRDALDYPPIKQLHL